jgi:hypothetical protein
MSTSVATADVNGTARTTAKPPKRMLTTETATRVTSGDGPAGSHDVGIDDVALERADANEHEQGERRLLARGGSSNVVRASTAMTSPPPGPRRRLAESPKAGPSPIGR